MWIALSLACVGPGHIADSSVDDGDEDVVVDASIEIELRRGVELGDVRATWLAFGTTDDGFSALPRVGYHHVPARVEVLDDRNLEVIPLERPPPGLVQEIRLLDVQRDGEAVAPLLRFRTRANPQVTSVVYSNTSQRVCDVDEQNRLRRCFRGSGSGQADQPFERADFDELGSRMEYRYDDFSRLVQVTTFGIDDDDEQFQSVVDVTYGEWDTPVEIRSTAVGDDGLVDTDDDQVSLIRRFELDDQGFLVATFDVGQGEDGMLGTADDEPSPLYTAYDRTEEGWVRAERLMNPGPDGLILTDDDTVGYPFSELVYDREGRVVVRRRTLPGEDDLPYTDDDRVEPREVGYVLDDEGRAVVQVIAPGDAVVTERDARGNVIQRYGLQGPGPDGEWLTPDDAFDDPGDKTGTAFEYDRQGRLLRRHGVGAGPDGTLFTADDTSSHRDEYAP